MPALKKEQELSAIVQASGLQEIEVMRALQWLENKALLKIFTEKKKMVFLDNNGQKYKAEGLPERKLLLVLNEEFREAQSAFNQANIKEEEKNICIGTLKKKAALLISKEGNKLLLKITPQGKNLLKKEFLEEIFLKKNFPLELETIKDEDKFALDELKQRKNFIKIEEEKKLTIQLTEDGKKLLSVNLEGEVLNRLTKDLLKSGKWKNKQFRAYDVEINVPKIYRGKKHFDNEALEYIKKIWLEMGFREMNGNYVQSAFWDLDALFVPQDHPAREMQDTFYLPGKAKLPPLWEKIKEIHENGGKTGSRGWGYKFSKEEAEKILLRTHTTVLSARTLQGLKRDDLPAKFFAVGKVFRNEALDWKHLFEFYQVEGIVVDPKANLKHLKGYLTEFYQKMGFEKVRMRPGHFPYTEPSLEVEVFHPLKKEWIELGGAGIFRPEVVQPLLGFDCPVLAWGQGMGRIIVDYWKIQDIRELYKNDLKQLREIKTWLK